MGDWRRRLRNLLPGSSPARRAGADGAVATRFAVQADLAAIAALLREGDRHHRIFDRLAIKQDDPDNPGEAMPRAWLDNPATLVMVSESNGAVTGFIRAAVQERPASRLRNALKLVVIEEIVVAEAARSLGTGTRLLEEAQTWARDRGAARLELQVYDANAAALGLYGKQRYRTLIRTLVRDL